MKNDKIYKKIDKKFKKLLYEMTLFEYDDYSEKAFIKSVNILFDNVNFKIDNENLALKLVNELSPNAIHTYKYRVINISENIIKGINVLLKNGVDVNEKDENGRTIVHIVIDNKLHASVIAQLLDVCLDAGFDINSTDNCGRTIIHCLCEVNNGLDYDEFIINNVSKFVAFSSYGINLDIKDENGVSVLETLCKLISSIASSTCYSYKDVQKKAKKLIDNIYMHNLYRLVDGLTADDKKNEEHLNSIIKKEYASSYLTLISVIYDKDKALNIIEKLLRIGVLTYDNLFQENIIYRMMDEYKNFEFIY